MHDTPAPAALSSGSHHHLAPALHIFWCFQFLDATHDSTDAIESISLFSILCMPLGSGANERRWTGAGR
jgi:hypothetical protein